MTDAELKKRGIKSERSGEMALVIDKPIPETPEKMFQLLMALIVQIAEKKEALSEDEVLGLLTKTYMTIAVLWAVSENTFRYAFENAEKLVGAVYEMKGE